MFHVEQQKMIDKYVELLKQYNDQVNIFAKSSYHLLDFHLQDSVHMAELVGAQPKQVVDLGSGGGFPSVLIAILNPQNKVTAIESKAKKASFLQQVQQELGLANFRVINADVNEVLRQAQADIYTAKAFKKVPDLIALLRKNAFGGRFCLVPVSANQAAEFANLPKVEVLKRGEEFFYLRIRI
jgi:16S rRNA (guanine527-N7)-methyltransferase